MDEAKLKEALATMSGNSYISSSTNDISGWVTETKPGKKAPKRMPKKIFASLQNSKVIYQKRPKTQIPSIRKPLSLFEFKSTHQSFIKYKKSPKKLKKNTRPASSINKSKPSSPEKKIIGKYSKISLDKTIVFNNLLSSTRKFSPNRSNGVNIFRRSSSSIDTYTQDSLLTVHGSSCNLKT